MLWSNGQNYNDESKHVRKYEVSSSSQKRKWCIWAPQMFCLMDHGFLYLLEGGMQGPGRRPHLPYLHLRLWMYRMSTYIYIFKNPLI